VRISVPTSPPHPAHSELPDAHHAHRQVSVGGGFTCGVTTDDRAYCWGHNGNGRLGDGTTTLRPRPHAVSGRGAARPHWGNPGTRSGDWRDDMTGPECNMGGIATVAVTRLCFDPCSGR
jgi:hypothetical protein